MNKLRLSALVLTGALSLSLLAACGGKDEAPAESTAPSQAPIESVEPSAAPSETPAVSETPAESTAPESSESPQVSKAPEASKAPVTTPAPVAPTPAPAEPTPAPAAPSQDASAVVSAFWSAVSAAQQPELMDLDADFLKEMYSIDANDLEAWLCKMPLMNTQATEYFFAKVKPGKLDTVKAALAARQSALEDQWKTYLPEQLELVQNYQLLSQGDWVCFAICQEYASIPGIFANCVK